MGIELADIFRLCGPAYRQKYAGSIPIHHLQAMQAIEACRTEALGGQVYVCPDCEQWAIWPASVLYARVLTPHRLVALAALLKLVYLLAGAAWAFACRDRLEEGNPARPAWFLLSLGLLSTFAGQLCLAPFQVVRNETPFPSVADIYYLLSYPLLIAALLVPLNAYRESGFPVGSRAERIAIVGVVAVIAALVAVPILRPVAQTGGPMLDRILNVAYPVLDLVLLLPLALLLRVALRLRGSRVGEVLRERRWQAFSASC